MTIIDYTTAASYLGRKADRPLPGRTSRIVRRDDNTIAIRYQQTDVVTYRADGTIILNSGGWKTVTTKARINEYTRVRLYADKGQWFIAAAPASLYYDGMAINNDGQPLTPQFPSKSDVQKKRALDKAISTYIKGFANDITENGLKDPDSGDCWGCLMHVANEPKVEQGSFRRQNMPTPHGRIEPMGIDHYFGHFEEKYYVPSLLMNAIQAAGYVNPGVIWHMIKSRKDGDHAARILRGYFSKMKPALLAAREAH
jgi:hypothetical protein